MVTGAATVGVMVALVSQCEHASCLKITVMRMSGGGLEGHGGRACESLISEMSVARWWTWSCAKCKVLTRC